MNVAHGVSILVDKTYYVIQYSRLDGIWYTIGYNDPYWFDMEYATLDSASKDVECVRRGENVGDEKIAKDIPIRIIQVNVSYKVLT